jgi:NAD(P)-dependent dehydrogenase (short-subunit alcohol dehydrogenase family)
MRRPVTSLPIAYHFLVVEGVIGVPDRVALVTGAASGIGAATASRLGDRGAVTVVDREAEGLQKTIRRIEDAGGRAHAVVADLREPGAAEQIVAACMETFGRLDVLVPAAGITHRTTAPETTDEDWQTVLDVDLTAVFRCCRAAIPVMRNQGGGVIVTVGSAWGVVAGPKTVAYAAAKAGVVNLTRALAIDHGPEGIRANCVCPGDIDTPLLREEMRLVGLDPDTELAESAAGRPLGRVGRPEDVAAAIVFLASEDSGYMTGTTLVTDGGWLAGG